MDKALANDLERVASALEELTVYVQTSEGAAIPIEVHPCDTVQAKVAEGLNCGATSQLEVFFGDEAVGAEATFSSLGVEDGARPTALRRGEAA